MNRAVILDRDGVINDNRHQPNVNHPEDLILFDFAAEAIRQLNQQGFLVLVATNQGGVGLNYMTKDALEAIHQEMMDRLKSQGAVIDGIAACTHAPRAGCNCRKPRPGLLYQLQRHFDVDLRKSYMVGDRQSDIDAGRAAGTKTVFVLSGADKECRGADHVCRNLLEAVDWIIKDCRTT
jgi:D-glycero-D-manno-heptose 1,7-bisphosphate phosphatase